MAGPVTDPELLKLLDAPEAGQGTRVTDPALLAQLEGAPAVPKKPEPSFTDRAGTAVRKFFDPGYGSAEPAGLGNVGKQALKAGAFLVPGSGLLPMAASGALYGAGSSDANDLQGMGKDAALGAAGGVAMGGLLKGAGALLGKVGAAGAEKSALASAKAGAKASEEVATGLQSAAGKAGAEIQKGSRYVENLMRLEESMTPEQRALYEGLKQSGVVPGLQQSVAQSTLEALPGQASTIAARRAEQAAAQSAAPQAVLDRTRALLSTDEAKQQLAARAWRYGPPAIGSLVGSAVGGPVGTAVGFLAGAGSRPMVQSLRRMANTPAVQKGLGDAMQAVGSLGGREIPAAAGAAGEALTPEIKALVEALRRRAGGGPGLTPAAADRESN